MFPEPVVEKRLGETSKLDLDFEADINSHTKFPISTILSHAHNLITSDCAANFTVHKARKNVILGRIEVCHVNYVCIDFQEERLMFTS